MLGQTLPSLFRVCSHDGEPSDKDSAHQEAGTGVGGEGETQRRMTGLGDPPLVATTGEPDGSDPGAKEETSHFPRTGAGCSGPWTVAAQKQGQRAKFWNQTDFGHLFLSYMHLTSSHEHSTPQSPHL